MSGLSDLSSSGAELLEQSLTQVDAQELTPPQSPAGPQQTPQQPLRVLRSNAHLVPTPPPPSQPFMQAPSIAAATGAGIVVPPSIPGPSRILDHAHGAARRRPEQGAPLGVGRHGPIRRGTGSPGGSGRERGRGRGRGRGRRGTGRGARAHSSPVNQSLFSPPRSHIQPSVAADQPILHVCTFSAPFPTSNNSLHVYIIILVLLDISPLELETFLLGEFSALGDSAKFLLHTSKF